MVSYFQKLAQRKYLLELPHEQCLHRTSGSCARILLHMLKSLLLHRTYMMIKYNQSFHLLLEYLLSWEEKIHGKLIFSFCVKSGPSTPAKPCWALSCSIFHSSFFSFFPLTFNLCKGLSAFVWKGKPNNCLDAQIVPGNLDCLYSNGSNGAAQQSSEKMVRFHNLPCDLRSTATDWQQSDLY